LSILIKIQLKRQHLLVKLNRVKARVGYCYCNLCIFKRGGQQYGRLPLRIGPLSNNFRCRRAFVYKLCLFFVWRASLRIGPTRAWHSGSVALPDLKLQIQSNKLGYKKLTYNKLTYNKAGSHGLVVKADGSWPRGRGFKPRHRILDGCKQFASYYIKKNWKIKVAKWGTK